MKNVKNSMSERVFKMFEKYAPIFIFSAVIVIAVLNACVWGELTHWVVGVLVGCFEIIGGFCLYETVNSFSDEDDNSEVCK